MIAHYYVCVWWNSCGLGVDPSKVTGVHVSNQLSKQQCGCASPFYPELQDCMNM